MWRFGLQFYEQYDIIHCTDAKKEYFNKELVITKIMMKILKTLVNVEFVMNFMLMVMLKKEIIVISLKNIEILHLVIVRLMLNHKISVTFHKLKNDDSIL